MYNLLYQRQPSMAHKYVKLDKKKKLSLFAAGKLKIVHVYEIMNSLMRRLVTEVDLRDNRVTHLSFRVLNS